MFRDSKDTWYKQLNFPVTEFRWARRKGPGLPFILEIRASQDHEMVFEYEVMDISKTPIGAYLRLAEGKIIEANEKKVMDAKRKRSEQFDKSEPERLLAERRTREAGNNAPKKEGEQLPEGSVGEPERKTKGGVEERDRPEGDDKVRLDSLPQSSKKKRGRPRKNSQPGGDGRDGKAAPH